MIRAIIVISICGFCAFAVTTAQDNPLEPLPVEIEAHDGLILHGDYWALDTDSIPEDGAPAVLLLHMLNSSNVTWQPLIEPLHEAGYHILAIDMRGHGDTGGTMDWEAAEIDVQTWLDWLKAQPNTQSVVIVGASIGGNLALMGCANDPDCLTAIALSPVLSYQGAVRPEDAVVVGMQDRSVLLIASQRDRSSVLAVRQMATHARGEVAMRIYTGGDHGTNMFRADYGERLIVLIIQWLDEHTSVS